jgi:hypothetical protein
MGNRGFNAGGWAYMRRVWCPLCGWSFLVGIHDDRTYDTDTDRPKRVCNRTEKCRERQRQKMRKNSRNKGI